MIISNQFSLFKRLCSEGYILFNFELGKASPFLKASKIFTGNNFSLSIIDPFGGKLPYIFCKEYFSKEKMDVRYVPTIILDSQLTTYLHQFVNHTLAPRMYPVIWDFLSFVVKHNFDYNPFFYCIEALCKSKISPPKESISKTLLSILTLHTMDEDIFLKSGKVVPDKNRISNYLENFGCFHLEEVAKKWFDMFNNNEAINLFKRHFKVSYVILLKMAIIQLTNKNPTLTLKKIQILYEFMEQTLNCIFSKELDFALYYFAGLITSFVPIQKNSNFDSMKPKLLASAWDIQLLRLNESMLVNNFPQEVVIGFVATADKVLCNYGKYFQLHSVIVSENDPKTPIPIVSTDHSALQKTAPDNVIKEVLDYIKVKTKNRISKLATNELNPISLDNLEKIILPLENELKSHLISNHKSYSSY